MKNEIAAIFYRLTQLCLMYDTVGAMHWGIDWISWILHNLK